MADVPSGGWATGPEPLLIVEAAPLARYDRLGVLEPLADKAPAARWLFTVEQGSAPYIDDRPAPGTLGPLKVSTNWAEAHHRSRVPSRRIT
jgi:hypothetical protein